MATSTVDPFFIHTPAAGKPTVPDNFVGAFCGFFTAVASTDLLSATAHGLASGNVVRFSSLGALPAPLVAGTDYYVIASGLTANAFKVSTTLGGGAVDITDTGVGARPAFVLPVFFTAATATDLLTSPVHGLAAGKIIRFSTDGTLPSGLSLAVDYYVLAGGLTANAFKVSLTPGGTAADITDTGAGNHAWSLTDAGASTHLFTCNAIFTAATSDLITSAAHGLVAGDSLRVASGGTLPAGLSALTDYFVIASGLTANDFKVSATLGGSAVDITSTGSGTHTWRRALSVAAAAEVTAYTSFRAPVATATNRLVPIVQQPLATLSASILKIAEWIAYWDGSTYLSWYVTDNLARQSQWLSASAGAGVADSSSARGGRHTLPSAGTANNAPSTICVARPTRHQILIRNLSTTVTLKVGPAGAVVWPILPGESLPFSTTDLLQGVTDAGTAVWAAADEYD